MSHEGLTFLVRGVVVLLLIIIGAIVRTFIGPSRRRGYAMSAGMLGGMLFGLLVSDLMPSSLHESAAFAVAGMIGGWSAAWVFARRIPRVAH
jgi:hypothetical protein